jgi:hypothetical protein
MLPTCFHGVRAVVLDDATAGPAAGRIYLLPQPRSRYKMNIQQLTSETSPRVGQ